jgi:uncharacterized protein with von Willebrand factor type A (vWA) domain
MARLSDLAAYMRAAGAHVGVGELLAAHRALAAVDPSSPGDAYYALRAALCSSHGDLALFAEAYSAVFAAPGERHNPLEELGTIERSVLPRFGVPAMREEQLLIDEAPVPAAWSDEELLR